MTMSHNTSLAAPASTSFRPAALSGLGFVVAVLAGNSLTETVSGTGVLGRLDAMASSPAAQLGHALELLGFVLLLVFVAEVYGRCRRGTSSRVALLAGGTAIAVKLGTAAAVVGAMQRRTDLDEASATAVVALNDAGFVLFWVAFGLFVAGAAVALRAGRAIGPALHWSGVVLGSLTVATGVLGAVTEVAVPIPFLFSLLWSAVLALRLSARIRLARPEAETIGR